MQNPHKLGWFLGFDKLTEIHSVWIKNFWTNQDDYILQALRNSYKTTSVIITGYIWFSLQYPDIPVLLIREEATNAQNTLRTISKLLQSEEMGYIYSQCYPGLNDFKLVRDNADSLILPTKTKITVEGSIDCIGAGGALVGRHYPRIVADDLITINDRISKAIREKKKLLIQELENIKTADGVMSMAGTPWHKDDGFRLFKDAGIEIDQYPLGTIDIKELTPERIERIKSKMSRSLFDANYRLKHTTDREKMFDNALFTEFKQGHPVKWHVDPAYSGKDTTAISTLYLDGDDIVVKGWVRDESIINDCDHVSKLIKSVSGTSGVVENNKDEGYTEKELAKRLPSVSGYHERQNKHYKIQQYLKANWNNIKFAKGCDPDYVNQILDYQEGEEPDDAPDSLASLLRCEGIGEVYNFSSGTVERKDDY